MVLSKELYIYVHSYSYLQVIHNTIAYVAKDRLQSQLFYKLLLKDFL